MMKIEMFDYILLAWYWLETRCTKFLNFLGYKYKTDDIPEGLYCYKYDEERNDKNPLRKGEFWVKPCKFYRSTKKTKCVACIYMGFIGFDPLLYDQCKMCEIKTGL